MEQSRESNLLKSKKSNDVNHEEIGITKLNFLFTILVLLFQPKQKIKLLKSKRVTVSSRIED